MKKWFLATAVMLAAFTTVMAQPGKVVAQKIGFINQSTVLDSLPMKDSAIAQLKVLNDYFNEDLATMKKEYDAKLAEYDAYTKGVSVDPIIKEMMENTLKTLDENIYNKNQKYQELIQRKQSELLMPILDSIKASSKIIAKQRGYTQVLDISNGLMIYNGNTADDLSDAVIKYMRAEAKKPKTPKPVAPK